MMLQEVEDWHLEGGEREGEGGDGFKIEQPIGRNTDFRLEGTLNFKKHTHTQKDEVPVIPFVGILFILSWTDSEEKGISGPHHNHTSSFRFLHSESCNLYYPIIQVQYVNGSYQHAYGVQERFR